MKVLEITFFSIANLSKTSIKIIMHNPISETRTFFFFKLEIMIKDWTI